MEGIETSIIETLFGDSRTGFVRYDRTYHGFRGLKNVPLVSFTYGENYAELLTPEKSLKVREHTLEGFEWGSMSVGAKQLALAILLEHYPKEMAEKHHLVFQRCCVSVFAEDKWALKEEEIREFVEDEEENRVDI